MESFVHLRKGRTPRRLHADLDGLKDDELGRGVSRSRVRFSAGGALPFASAALTHRSRSRRERSLARCRTSARTRRASVPIVAFHALPGGIVLPGMSPRIRDRAEDAMAALPSGIVTFLFTDIEGSSRLWERDRPAMARAVARHDALLTQAVTAHHGVPFKHVGDMVQAAFWSPAEIGLTYAMTAPSVSATAALPNNLYIEMSCSVSPVGLSR